MKLEPTYFARVVFRGLDLGSATTHYCAWVLGTGDFARLRERRLDLGVLPEWTLGRLEAGGSFVGEDGCEVTVELLPRSADVHLVHLDERDEDVVWHSRARIHGDDREVLIEHGVGREAPETLRLEPVAATPAVFAALLEKGGLTLDPPEFRATAPVTLEAQAAGVFVPHVLLSDERKTPIVVVAAAERSSDLDPRRLARALRGVAPVACLPDLAASLALERAFEGSGYQGDFGCDEGSARLYYPSLSHDRDPASHPRFGAAELRRFAPQRRTSSLAGEIIAHAARRTLPDDFFA